MDILYQDPQLLVCVKPRGVLSTDEPGGLPELLRAALGERCGGNFRYTASGIKSCEACLVPHQPGNYARILDGSRLVCELVRRPPVSEGKN